MARRRTRILAGTVVGVVVAAALVALLLRGGDAARERAPAAVADEPLAYLTGLAGADLLVDADGRAPLAAVVLARLLPSLTGGAVAGATANALASGRAAIALTGAGRTLALTAPDAAALRAIGRGLRRAGRHRGARLFGARGAALAVRGATLLAASTAADLRRALDARAAPAARFARASFERRLRGLPAARAAVRATFAPRSLLRARASALAASRWGRSLRDGAAVLVADATGARVPFRITAEPAGLTAADLPVATGPREPVARGAAPLVLGVRSLARLASFASAAGLEPFATLARLPGPLRPDIGALTADATLTSRDGRRYTARTEPPDPGDWREKLGRLDALSGLIRATGLADVRVDRSRDGAYTLEQGGRPVARAGVFGRALVLSTDPRADLRAAAAVPATPPPPGARGALTLRLTPDGARRLLLGGAALPGLLLDHLGDLTGSARVELTGVTGELRLGVR